jgi:hypothetical protein
MRNRVSRGHMVRRLTLMVAAVALSLALGRVAWADSGAFNGGPQGPTGAAGPTGPTGPTGPMGPAHLDSIYGNGEDGDIVIDSASVNVPSTAGIADWQANHSYQFGDKIQPTGHTGLVMQNLGAGACTSAAVEPDWASNGFDPTNRVNYQCRGLVVDNFECVWEPLTRIGHSVQLCNVYAHNVTINAGQTLHANNYALWVNGTFTIAATGTYENAGASASGMTSGNGSQTSSGMFDRRLNSGSNGGTSIGCDAAQGGSGTQFAGFGGIGGTGDGGVGGSTLGIDSWYQNSSAVLLPLVSPYLDGWLVMPGGSTLGSFFTGGNSGGCGGGDGVAANGGGAGEGGGVVSIYALNLVLNGTIDVSGGNGGNGACTGGATGGGGDGGGGLVFLTRGSRSGAGTINISHGTPGNGCNTGTNGTAGTDGKLIELVNQ